MRIHHLVAPLCLLVAPLTAQQEASSPSAAIEPAVKESIQARCQSLLLELIEQRRLPGASAAIALPDGEVLTIAVGLADVEAGRDLTPRDRLLSGSIGKTYVTAAAHHLIQAGKLSLDAYAAEFFDDQEWFPRVPNAGDITVEHLLRHQTGIPRYVFKSEFWAAMTADPNHVWKPAELLAYVLDEEPEFPAGEGWAYADTNYVIAGMIIEKVAGTTFYEYVQESLLAPHGLEDTVPSDSRRIPGLTQGYVATFQNLGLPERALDEDGVFVINPQFEWCGGGYANTPADLARWARILFSGRAFEGDYLETMLGSTPAVGLMPGTEYGLGVMLSETKLGPFRGHDGIMVGFLSTMGYYPEADLAAALQFNTDNQRQVGKPPVLLLHELAAIAAEELDA